MTREARLMVTARHEALHEVAIFVILGGQYVGKISRKRDPEFHTLGRVELTDLPQRDPALNAADVAVVRLLPLFDPGCGPISGSEDDVRFVQDVCAPIAYKYRPQHERHLDVAEWLELWLHGPIADRCRELLADSRVQRMVLALEDALDSVLTLEPNQVRAIMEALLTVGGRSARGEYLPARFPR